MRILTAYVTGYGRLVDAKINLDTKVIAVVGPNEAGKTTLLKALAFLDVDEELPAAARSRAMTVDDDTVIVSVKYVLDDLDRAQVADFDLAESPTSLMVSRTASGQLRHEVLPTPRKNPESLRAAVNTLLEALSQEVLDDVVDPATTYGDPGGDAAQDFRGELRGIARRALHALAERRRER